MAFATPTTKEEMYAILKDIFYYYRIKREGFQAVTLQDLALERLDFTPLTDVELLTKAQTLNASKQQEFRVEYEEKINKELAIVNEKIASIPMSKQARINKINTNFNESVNKLNVAIAQNGLSGSSIAVDKLALLELEKNRLLADIESEYEEQGAVLRGEQEALISKLAGAATFCGEIADKENQAKQKELISEQEKTVREIFKYNNGLDEKEQRYANNILQTNASLNLRFLEIKTTEYTKDQLVEMGYYEDVISCVCAYYNTLPTLTAAQQVMRDTKIVEYLDDYYESVVYMYQQRALAES